MLSPPAADDSDFSLVDRIRAGDERAFKAVWDRHHLALADFAYRYLRNRDAAMDTVQQVFFTLWQQRSLLSPRHTLASYLYSAVRHRVWNVLKHQRVERAYEEMMSSATPDISWVRNYGEEELLASELDERIRTIVNQLTPRVREIFLMSREDGLTPAQIAEVLGISQQVVYNQLSKALRALAQELSQELDP